MVESFLEGVQSNPPRVGTANESAFALLKAPTTCGRSSTALHVTVGGSKTL